MNSVEAAAGTGTASLTVPTSKRSRIALRIAYDGAGFPGWQTQPSRLAIQDRLEAALCGIAGQRLATVCAGRTDAGVHALNQVVHFDAPVTRPLQAWVRGVNALLPDRVSVQSAAPVGVGFHARFGAQRRAYTYVIHRSTNRHPMTAGRAGWTFHPLDVARMSEAASMLVGEHDFSAFRSSQCQARSPVRQVERIALRESGELLIVDLRANAFLHHMVRNIVGALVWVGIGRRPADWVGEILRARDRRLAAPTFAPDGLYLSGVDYGPGVDLGCWPPACPPIEGLGDRTVR
ncbi:MAG: tRNA pseudouridine synthase [Pseudomonadota bacterium]|jgi:tRNA pseudouridine38-40 synthase